MILTLLRGNDMEHETVGNLGNTSKAEILRAFVTEKLTAAAQEILAVVERTVAGYEEEVSGLRQEADRHRSQLEVLLQTEIKVEATDEQQLFPTCEPVQEEASAGGAGDLPEEEQQQQHHKNESVSYGPLRDLCLGPPWTLGQGHLHPLTPPDGRSAQIMTSGAGTVHKGVEDDGGVGVPCRTGGESSERAASVSTQVQDRLSEPESETASRSLPPTVQSDRRRLARSRISDTQTHVDLRVCILKDSNIDVLSSSVFKKFPMQELLCPRGLQEADFLDLLRSRFPQLRPDKPFDVFITDRSRKLQPLTVETLTPEEIYRSIRSLGNSALYIRLKTREEQQTQSKSKDAAAADSPSAADQATLNTWLLSSRVKSDRKSASRRPVGAAKTHVDLRIRILEDLHLNVVTPIVFRKCRLWELQCPRGLQEADFLDMLRSRFPQLGPDKLFDFFTSDRHRTLQPLTAQTLTPEEIFRAAGSSVLFIRLKPLEEVQTKEKLPAQRKPPPAPDQTRLNTSVQPDTKKSGRSRISDTQNHIDLRIRILEDSQISVLSTRVFKKCPVLELQCPRGLQEADFLVLLRSSFPQLRPDKPFDVFTTNRSRKLLPLRVETLTPEEIYRSINLNKNIVLFIRLKAQEEKLDLLPRKADAAKVSLSVPAETRLHTRTTVQQKGKTRMDLHNSPAREDRETGGGDDSVGSELSGLWSLQPLLLSESEPVENEVNDEDWKPDKSNGRPRNKEPEKTIRRRHSERSGFQTEGKPIQASPRVLASNGDARPSCKVCGALRGSMSMVIRHAWSHVNDPERLCGVCGEHSKSSEELMSHLQSHQKTHSCNICGKSFLSTSGLNGHIARHKGEKPYKCKICHKAFAEKSVLTNHKWVHTVEKPHKCDICQKSCISKIRLKHHLATHSGEKPYSCNTCSKPLSSLETLSQHMLTHAVRTAVRERPHGCEICKKRFFTNYRLQIHMRRHVDEQPKGSRAIVASV